MTRDQWFVELLNRDVRMVEVYEFVSEVPLSTLMDAENWARQNDRASFMPLLKRVGQERLRGRFSLEKFVRLWDRDGRKLGTHGFRIQAGKREDSQLQWS